jgi:hypothetical protein
MSKFSTPFLGMQLATPGSQEPFRTSDVNAAFGVVDTWANTTETSLTASSSALAALTAALAAGTQPVGAAGLTGTIDSARLSTVPVAKGGTGGTTVATGREGLRVFVQATAPSSPQADDLWFWGA